MSHTHWFVLRIALVASFTDPAIPAGFAPFGIRTIEGLLFVTYAKQLAPENHDDEAGPGNGFVVVFDPDGHRAQPPFFQAFGRQGQPFPDTRSEADAGRGAQAAGSAPTAEAAAPPSRLRPILEDPGRRCIVSFGDFKPLLASQLSHPERLRDGHRLDCHVQVYEATTPMRLRSITDVGPLCPLTKEIAARLALNDLVGEPNRRPVRPAPDVVVPGERLFLLKPIDDPTLATSAQPSEPPAPRPAVQQPERVPAPRTTIPERFLKPWELRLDREDALDAIDRERGLFRRLIEGLRSWGRRRELRRWQVLLSGHSADEQLWGIQPPRGGLHSHLVRDWARHTLRLAGYDARTMLLEWEVFWRRKGL